MIRSALARARRARRPGFTLTEVMVTIFIIGLLATVVLINVLPAMDQSRKEKVRADIAALETALEQFRLDLGSYPTTEQGLEALVAPPSGLRNPERYREGGYIRRLPTDPWNTPYQYLAPGQNSVIDIFSLGADGREGGEGADADIGNWT